MSAENGIFSLRIVTADFYMEKPKHGLDPCFSEFRAKEIKKVPIIRIFGSNAEGQKTCMHVHGIFPYLYIPYDKKDFDTLDKAVYLIASSIDKAINISLGQGSSGSQHVFKMQLVKGIPFYGYHKQEHQYLKIYMLNPRFIRRTANLLQNGAIMGKIFQPHESHVPYILQFFIDYNLYGMSFLHVPKEVIKFRRKNEEDVIPYPIQKEQILDVNVAEKQTTSKLELDIGSAFILNRFQLMSKKGTHSNPGIEAIWHDERVRREKLSGDCDEVPPLEIPISQGRPNVKPTDSDVFYHDGLVHKLMQMETSMDQTIDATLQSSIAPSGESNAKEKKRTFNLKKLIANAVYPEECSQEDNLTTASFIEDHLSNRSIFHTSMISETPSIHESDDVFMDDTIVDEELVLSLTQPMNTNNQSLREEDMELLDVMQQLEAGEEENGIDLDSTLAPLSQNIDLNSPQKAFESASKEADKSVAALDNDSDNECFNDFSIIMDDMDELLLKLSQPCQPDAAGLPEVAQYDGADDALHTPKKSTQRRLSTLPTTPSTPTRTMKTCTRSPRTPNSVAKKYAPLPIIIQSHSLKKSLMNSSNPRRLLSIGNDFDDSIENDEIISVSSEECVIPSVPSKRQIDCLRKKLVLTELRRKSSSADSDDIPLINRIHKRRKVDFDKTRITCNLRTPRNKTEKRLKVYNANAIVEPESVNLGELIEVASQDSSKSLPSTKNGRSLKSSISSSNENTPLSNKFSPKVLLKKGALESNEKNPINMNNRSLGLKKKNNTASPKILQSTKDTNNGTPTKCNTLPHKKISPRVLIRKHVLNLKSPKATEHSECLLSQQHVSKVSPQMYIKENGTEFKKQAMELEIPNSTEESKEEMTSGPRALLKKSVLVSSKGSINNCEDVPQRVERSKLNSSNINPKVLVKKCSRIKDLLSLGHNKDPSTVQKTKCRLSLESHRKLKERREKQKSELKVIREKLYSTEIVDDCLPLSALKKKLSINELSKTDNVEDCVPLSALQTKLCGKETPNENLKMTPETPTKSPTKRLKIRLKREPITPLKTISTLVEKRPKTPKTPKAYSFIVDNKYEIIPVAGPSHLDRFKIANISTPRTPRPTTADSESDIEDDPTVYSFYEKSFIVDSPVFSEISPSSLTQPLKCSQSLASSSSDNKTVIITPHQLPETYEQVAQNYKIYNIPDMVHQKPFYGNYDDVTHRKEVGHTVLNIPGKSLTDLEDFQSTIPDLKGISYRRKKMMQALGVQFRNEDHFREYLSTEEPVTIIPANLPPTKHDAKVWLKAKELLKEKGIDAGKRNTQIEEDSPIKIRRQKVVMLMESEAGEVGDDMDCSIRSVTLSPLTPVVKIKKLKTCNSPSATSLTVLRSRTRARVSLSQKLKNICISNAVEKCSGEDLPPTVDCEPKESLSKTQICSEDDVRASQESTKTNETISSEAVLAELEKSSFLKDIHSSQESLETSFGLSIATLNNTYGFKVNLENLQQAKSDVEHNYLTTLSIELFISTREDFLPNPQIDPIKCIFYAIDNSIPSTCTDGISKACGFIIVSDSDSETTSAKFNGIDSDVEIKVVANELEGLANLLELCAHWDPDIFVGYEIEMSSWGYVMERAKFLDLNIAPLLSRVPSQKVRDFIDEDRDQFTDLDVETKLCGRILLDVWRLMRSEIALTSYTFENVMYHIMHRRCPLHTHRDLSKWFQAPQTRWIVLEYYLERAKGTLELLDQLDLIGRTAEMAKLIGIQFYEVLSRGSQFRVESMMLRIAKPKNLVPLSPSVQQRAHMRAPEYLPLILEPQSRFYPDPVIVLDFQSLYPSMIMAYNYCFSTCLGRVEHLGQSVPFEFGASQLRVSPTVLRKFLDHDLVSISPCGAVFVKREIREGILPRMLSEVLDTRQMVKQSMKLHKNSTALQRILHSRQLGLKLIANVTYGYTAANFSGRMPCVEVGDSVVAKGRETLERAIKLVEANEQWNVRVVYGDTDSLFVVVPGRSRAEAFKIGAEIAQLVTNDNPQPVKLKLEKVYQPCILQTKKRYVGYMYESPDQIEPVFEAKGIETVRRDGCPAVAKMLEKCLRILFESADVSQVKKYVCRQFTKLLSGKANIQDLIFAKEFRGLNGYKPTACVPALELTRKWMLVDPRKIPRRGERVPFIVTNGPPGLPLIKLVRSPHEVLADEGLKINAIYYITKAIIPPLNRCFLLIGADVNDWFTNLPRKMLFTPALSAANEIIATNATKKSTISQYFSSTNCIIGCGRQTKQGICTLCSNDATKSVVTLEEKISKLQRGYYLTQAVCQACSGRSNFIDCASLDCPVLYVLEVKRRELSQIPHIHSILEERYEL